MIGGRRVLRIRDAGNGLTPLISSFLADPAGDALIVIEAGDLAKTGSLRQLFSRSDKAAAVACYADNAQTLKSLIRSTLSAQGLSIDPDALPLLAARLGSDRGVRDPNWKSSRFSPLAKKPSRKPISTRSWVMNPRFTSTKLPIRGIGRLCPPGSNARPRLGRRHDRGHSAAQGDGAFPASACSTRRRGPGGRPRKRHEKIAAADPFLPKQNFCCSGSRWNSEKLMQALTHLYEAEALTRTTGIPEEAACSRALFSVAALAQARSR